MKRVVVDCGTAYSKVHYLETGRRRIVPSRRLLRRAGDYRIECATGHNRVNGARTEINELVALAEGALRLLPDGDFTVLDCGARDLKYIRVKNRSVVAMDWNTECGAFAGQVIELLQQHFEIDPGGLPAVKGRVPVVCGVLGMTGMFDRISQGVPYRVAFAEFLRGIAHNCQSLVGNPDRLYLSGGLCENPAFVASFDCPAVPLGRHVLVEGMLAVLERRDRRKS
ncbi:MAG: ATPase [bacterium]